MRREFKLLARVMKESLPQEYPYTVAGADQTIMAQDFDDRVDVIPVSDPNIFSQAQRIALAQAQLQLATQAPEMHDMYEALHRMYEALGVRDIDKILKPQEEQEAAPKDPATENIDALNQVQMQAFEGQNHDAHIMSHLVFGASGIVAQAPMIAVALQKHVMDHVRLKAVQTVMEQVTQMMQGQEITPEIDVQVQALVAQQIAEDLQALRELNSQITGEAGQPDPLIALKEQELQMRSQKDQAQIELDRDELALAQQKAEQRAQEQAQRMQQTRELTMVKLQATADRERMRVAAQLQMANQRRQ
jgi:hypothetical protein